MIGCINPPCNRSLAASSVALSIASSSDDGRETAPVTEDVLSSAETEFVIKEDASTISLARNPCVLPDLFVAVREGENVSATSWII